MTQGLRFTAIAITFITQVATAAEQPPTGTGASPTAKVTNLWEISQFPISVPGVKGALLEKTSSVDMMLAYGEPGTKLHRHNVSDHFVLVLRGEGIVRLGDRAQRAGPGTLITIPARLAHSILKSGEGEFAFLAISSPPLDPKDFEWLEK